jgi:hypothetical protein
MLLNAYNPFNCFHGLVEPFLIFIWIENRFGDEKIRIKKSPRLQCAGIGVGLGWVLSPAGESSEVGYSVE